jgi:hypothetical protein
MGLSRELALGTIRFSLGRESTQGDIERVVEVLPAVVAKVRKLAGVLGRTGGRTERRTGGRDEGAEPAGAVPPSRRTAEGRS